jgi:glycine/D-amino acid oxidase-like deaminating enzyme
MRIAVLGAGGAGVCTALELALRGYAVDLYDENSAVLTQASRNNEGKVHLGLVYARDGSEKTAETMILGAIHFSEYLRRWTGFDKWDDVLSTPYYYVVHKGTMSEPAALERHYHLCRRLFEEAREATGLMYLGNSDRTLQVERVSQVELERIVSPEYCTAAFRTSERSVDPRAIADLLAAAVASEPRIRLFCSTRVTGASWHGTDRIRITLRTEDGHERADVYDRVVNALWDGRLAIDAALGLMPERSWIYRYKLGGWIPQPVSAPADIPSLTMVLGPFGDTVNFGPRGLYFSWYPTGLAGSSHDLAPSKGWGLTDEARATILQRSYEELARRVPALASGVPSGVQAAAAGGVIFAWGNTGIDEPHSHLHTRHEIGVYSTGPCYHSINTGKYTMAPYLGYHAATRVLGG